MSAEKKLKNLSIEDRAAALDAIEKLNKGEEVKLGGQHIKYYKDIAEHFGVTKSEISKLKSKIEKPSRIFTHQRQNKKKQDRSALEFRSLLLFVMPLVRESPALSVTVHRRLL